MRNMKLAIVTHSNYSNNTMRTRNRYDNREVKNIEDVRTSEVNSLLGHFAMKIRRRNRTEYEPNKISSLFLSFDRHLKDNRQPRSIVFDRLNQVKQSLFISIIIIFTKYRIKTSFNGWSCNMAWILHSWAVFSLACGS